MRHSNSNGSGVIVLVIVVFVLAICGYGGAMGRGLAFGVGREAAHSMFRR